MWLVLDHFSRTLIDAAIANAILLSLVSVLVVFTRQPSRRIVLAQAGVYAGLLMLPLVAFEPLPRVYPVDWLLRTGLLPPPLTPVPAPPDFIGPPKLGSGGELFTRGRSRLSEAEWPAGTPAARTLSLLHVAGATAGLVWFSLGLWGFQRLLARSTEPSPRTREVFDDLILDLERPPPQPDLRVSTRLRSPVLGGLVHPCIVIPKHLDDEKVGREPLRLILLHELAHADRGDAWFGALAGLAQVLWFFLPHFWWLRSQLRIDQEFLADRKAAGTLGESTVYARWLVGLSGAIPGIATAVSKVESGIKNRARLWREGGFNTPLLQRVAMLLYCPFAVEDQPPRWYTTAMPALLMIMAILVSTCRILAPIDPMALMHQAQPSDALVRSFQIPQFAIVPAEQPSGGKGGCYVLPLSLPPTFHLRAEIQATPSALAQIRISGYPLSMAAPDAQPEPPNTPTEAAAWHPFSIRRSYSGVTVTVDDKLIPVAEATKPGPQWLTITPAALQAATLRNLVITW